MKGKFKERAGTSTAHRSRTGMMVRALLVVSVLLLYFSGLGQMPIYQRYYITSIPGFTWTGDYFATLRLHYIFAAVLIFAYVFHLVYHWGRDGFFVAGKKVDNYREARNEAGGKGQERFFTLLRLSQVLIHVNILLLIASGIVKVIKNLPAVDLPYALLVMSTALHNLATLLLLVSCAAYFLIRLLQRRNASPVWSDSGVSMK
ncbi:MAG: hypothetical protein AB1796_01130 [Bacillota bacterium]